MLREMKNFDKMNGYATIPIKVEKLKQLRQTHWLES